MTAQNAVRLKKQLKELGLEEASGWFDAMTQTNQREFNVYISKDIDDDKVMCVLHFEKQADEYFDLKYYDITVRHIDIPNITIAGVNTLELESRMQQADEMYNQYYTDPQKVTMRESYLVESINNDIDKLIGDSNIGKETAHLLLFKYWPEGEYSRYLVKGEEMERKYESTLRVGIDNGELLTASDAYYQIKLMHREHVLSDEVFAQAKIEFSEGNHWVAYNGMNYFIDKGDAYFFKDEESAREFSRNNISDDDSYNVMHCRSPDELLRRIPYGEQLRVPLINNKNLSTMNEKNFDYLKDNLKYMGFGEKQHEVLEANLREGKDSFQLTFNADVNKKPFEAVLQFRKSDTSDMYFLNSYHATLERSNGEKKDQTFYLNKGKGVTAKEAYNLLEGRPVFKELTNKANEPYKAWIQLDFENKDKHQNHEVKQFHENYGYDLRAAVGKFAVKELDGGDNEKKLLHSLEKGNIQSVTIEKAGAEVKMFIEANPQYKTVTVYDEQFKRVQKEDLVQYQSAQKEVKQNAGHEQKEMKEDQKQGKQVGKKNKDDAEDSLLPKKRNRQKKGMGLK